MIFSEGLVQELQKYHMQLRDEEMKDSREMKPRSQLNMRQVGKPTLFHNIGG